MQDRPNSVTTQARLRTDFERVEDRIRQATRRLGRVAAAPPVPPARPHRRRGRRAATGRRRGRRRATSTSSWASSASSSRCGDRRETRGGLRSTRRVDGVREGPRDSSVSPPRRRADTRTRCTRCLDGVKGGRPRRRAPRVGTEDCGTPPAGGGRVDAWRSTPEFGRSRREATHEKDTGGDAGRGHRRGFSERTRGRAEEHQRGRAQGQRDF